MRFNEFKTIKSIKPIKPLTLDKARIKDMERQDALIKQRIKREKFRQSQKNDILKGLDDHKTRNSGY